MTITKYLTTAQAAAILGLDESQVRRLVRKGTLATDQEWASRPHRIDAESVAEYAKSDRRTGPKKKT